jgi:phage anti-repressor protein
MSELNIIQLIENHPISKLTDTYNVKLLNKIKDNFSDKEQQLFIGSFYCYLNYDTKNEFVVDLDDVWQWIGFSKKYYANTVLNKHFIEKTDYINLDTASAVARLDDEKWGGQNIKKIMMTIKCFKSLCLKAQTKKASEIHEYYLKMEEILHEVIGEEGIELKQKMEQQKLLLDQKTAELKSIPEQEKHKLIMKQYGFINGSLVYVARIKTLDNGKYIIKIGESRRGVRNRYNEFKQKYGSHVIFLDAFLVNNSSGFEKFLHTHELIRRNKVTDLKDHENENELFLIGQNLSYRTLLDIIETNQSHFDYSFAEYEKLKIENEKLQLELAMLKEGRPVISYENDIKELISMNKLLLTKVNALEEYNKLSEKKSEIQPTKILTKFNQIDSHIGPRLQKINPENLQEILYIYETVTDAIKENPKLKRPSLNKAVKENTIYCGFRWLLVDRDLDSNTIHSIEPTKKTRSQHVGYVAKLNKDKTEIIQVYLDRKTAAHQNGYISSSALDNPVKNNTLSNGFYYMLFDLCEEDLKENWTTLHGECILYKDGVGQFDKNNTLIREFICKDDCVKKISISQKSLAKVLDKNVTYDNYYFKSLGSKVYM